MDREEILQASRRENRNKDMPELELAARAGAVAMQAGAVACALLAIFAAILADTLLYSPWVIYFCILGTNWSMRFAGQKRVSDLAAAILFFALMALAAVFLALRLVGGKV